MELIKVIISINSAQIKIDAICAEKSKLSIKMPQTEQFEVWPIQSEYFSFKNKYDNIQIDENLMKMDEVFQVLAEETLSKKGRKLEPVHRDKNKKTQLAIDEVQKELRSINMSSWSPAKNMPFEAQNKTSIIKNENK